MWKKGSISPFFILYGTVIIAILIIVVILSEAISFGGPPNPDDFSRLPGGFEPAGSKLRKLIP